jgi:hypothetical protein
MDKRAAPHWKDPKKWTIVEIESFKKEQFHELKRLWVKEQPLESIVGHDLLRIWPSLKRVFFQMAPITEHLPLILFLAAL